MENLMGRRRFLTHSALWGLGAAALADLGAGPALGASPGASGPAGAHFRPTAKRVIYLFMSGAPSQLDLFDYKPGLVDLYDTDLPESIRNGQRLTTMTSGQKRFPIAPTRFEFSRKGKSGAWVSEALPYLGEVVDDLAIVRSVTTDAINHDPAITLMQTGNQIPGKASLGSWLSYGLGSMNRDLPAYVVLNSTWSAKRDAQALFARLWGSGFLPSKHQGVRFRSQGDPALYLSDPAGVQRETRRVMLDGLRAMNQRAFETSRDPETLARIEQYEMAFRMQRSVPELTEISDESESVRRLYGPDVETPGTFAHNCLLARRMVERDVRCVQIFHRGWDHHGQLPRDLPLQCRDVDQPAAALIRDLKSRGLLDDTLVVWGGEFGRTVYCQGTLTKEDYGRDHHPRCFTMWMAGGGVKPGLVYGETDDFSYNVVRDPVPIRDLNATILATMGLDHKKLTYPFQGLDQRLTGVVGEPKVVKDLLA